MSELKWRSFIDELPENNQEILVKHNRWWKVSVGPYIYGQHKPYVLIHGIYERPDRLPSDMFYQGDMGTIKFITYNDSIRLTSWQNYTYCGEWCAVTDLDDVVQHIHRGI